PSFHAILLYAPPRPPSSPLFPYTTLFRSTPPVLVRRSAPPLRLGTAGSSIAGSAAFHSQPGSSPKVRRKARAWAAHQSHLPGARDRKSTRLNSSHVKISYAVFCLKKKTCQ